MTTPSSPSIDPTSIPAALRSAGVAGAGGAGFPSYVKWTDLESTRSLLVNHQESEPVYYADKWLAREHASEFAAFLDDLLDATFDRVVIGAKAKDRDPWTRSLEDATGADVYGPEDLPIDPADVSGVAVAYTPDVYTYSEERVLLMVTTGTAIGEDLPTEHGWIVHNTESLYNVMRALRDGTPVTRKYVHVDGDTPRHRCLSVPVGTTAATLLEAAGIDEGAIASDQCLADGGPGWCYAIEEPPAEFGVRKRTNAVLVLDDALVEEHTDEDGRIDVLTARDWTGREHETEPTPIDPAVVRIPLITNAAYTGLVTPSEPTVEPGDAVAEGDVVAAPAGEGIGIAHHASIDGTVAAVTGTHVIIERG